MPETTPQTTQPTAQQAIPPAGGDKKTVLLIEDDVFLSNLLTSRLTKAGLNVVRAYDGEEAIEKLRDQKPDLVLLDIIIPKKTGFDVLEEIQNYPLIKDVPVIIISNLGQESDIQRAMMYGIKGYLVKAENSIDGMTDAVTNFLNKGTF